MIFPETLLTEVVALIPDMTALALTTPSWVGHSGGTMMVIVAECGCGDYQPSVPSQVRSG